MTYHITFPDASSVDVAWNAGPQGPLQMLCGNSTRNTSSAADVAASDSIYGAGHVMRLYNTGSLTAPSVSDRSIVGSFKSLSGVSVANMNKYYRLYYQHEIDSKVKKGDITLAQWKSDMATLKAMGSTSLSVCLTADCFVNASKNPNDYIIPGITHYGVDFDGISSATGYHDYTTALNAVKSWATANGFTIGVPEFGANRASTSDPTGVARSNWMIKWMHNFKNTGFEFVCFWEYQGQAGSEFDLPPETAVVSTALQLGPTTN